MKEKRFSLAQNIRYVIEIIWKYDKILFLLMCIEILLGTMIPLLRIYLPKLAIDLIENKRDIRTILQVLGIYCFLMIVIYGIHAYVKAAKYWKYNYFNMNYLYRLFRKTLDCDYKIMEDDDGQTRYQKAVSTVSSGDSSSFSRMIPSLVNLMIGFLGLGIYSTILTQLNIVIPIVLMLGSCINYFAMHHVKKYIDDHKMNWTFLDKQLQYFETTSTDFSYGKDIRLFRLKDWIVDKRNDVHKKRIEWDKKIENGHFISNIVDAMIVFLRDGLAYIYLIFQVCDSRISIAEFVLFFGLISEFSNWITSLVKEANELSVINVQINDMRDFMENTNQGVGESSADIKDLIPVNSIRFDNVSFSYGEHKVLDHFSMDISSGEKIALVGLNGAGKTTLVKLLCGFYQPDEGKILINNKDIQEYSSTDRFSLFSTVFQDTYILPFSIAENVALKPEEDLDRQRVEECIKKAGLESEINNLKSGIDTKMLKLLDEQGIQLSGGQVQKLLLARALYKDAPILILDEPTAAFDPIAENKLYLKYYDLTRQKTSIFISHRLASTQFCDRIIMLEHGCCVEQGSHFELLQQRGRYSELFDIQMKNYMDGGKS